MRLLGREVANLDVSTDLRRSLSFLKGAAGLWALP
jgi:hypothetical protein